METQTLSSANQARLRTLESAPLDRWIALSEDQSRIVAIGETYGELAAQLDAVGDTKSVVLKTPPFWGEFAF